MAAYKGHAELIPCVLQAGFTAAQLDLHGRTPLHYAALQGCQPFELLPGSSGQPRDAPAAAAALQETPHASPGRSNSGAAAEPPDAEQLAVEEDRAIALASARLVADVFRGLSWQAPGDGSLSPQDTLRYESLGSSSSSSSSGSAGVTSPPKEAPLPRSIPSPTRLPPPLPGPALASPLADACWPQPAPRDVSSKAAPGLLPAAAPPQRQLQPPGQAWPAPSHWAGLMPRARIDYPGAAELLLVAGADVHVVDAFGCSAVHYAAGLRMQHPGTRS
jgi:hypothetical protein